MNQTIDTLAGFIKGRVKFIQSEDELFEEKTFDIYEEGTEEMIGICVLDTFNQLTNYSHIDTYEPGDLAPEDMPAIAETFIKAFYPHGLKQYALQSVIDLDDIYMVTYGIKEEKHGLELPGIGFSLTISTAGNVVQFSYDHDPIKIQYPAHMISMKEAKEKYASFMDFELIIQHMDKETFANGNDTYRLVYSLKEAAVDIPASGDEPAVVAEGNQYEPLKQHASLEKSIYEMIGITKNHIKIGEQLDEECIIEKWIHASMELPKEIDFTEVYSEQMITIHFNLKTNKPTVVYNGVPWKGERERLTDDVIHQHAHDFLYKVFPEAQMYFLREMEEPEEEVWMEDFDEEVDYEDLEIEDMDDEDLEYMEYEEESMPFYFQYHINHVPIEEKVTSVQVGVYSGNIVSASVEPIDVAPLLQIQTTPKLTKAEANEKLMQKLQMELSMALEYDEDGNPYYQLVYLPSFPETIGHIRMIDAENGKAYYVEVGKTVFF